MTKHFELVGFLFDFLSVVLVFTSEIFDLGFEGLEVVREELLIVFIFIDIYLDDAFDFIVELVLLVVDFLLVFA